MAPGNDGTGTRSRFTCETCHFEGGIDGRVHFTGRGEIHAATKPLYGLFNNKPLFSRALDRDLTAMIDNEFRVAGAGSGRDPWFSVTAAEAPWLGAFRLGPSHGPEELRAALLEFLRELTHPPNPAATSRSRWNPEERRGAEILRERCESCHSARLVADDPFTRVDPSRWEELILSEAGPLVWASGGYARTGVEPYVHDWGTRVPSLRRVVRKRPYFTDGSARTLEELLRRARFSADVFLHAGGDEDSRLDRLDEESIRALRAFLRLL